MTTKKYFPFILCLGLLLIHFVSGYPGGVTPDSIDQFQQSLSGNFNAHHPPVMAMLWSLFNNLYKGPQTILLMHLVLLWGGVLLLFYADSNNKFRWLYFVVPLTPQVLSHSTMIWKDVGFGLSIFFVISACIYYTYKTPKVSLKITLILLIVCFYGIAVKFQGQFIAPIIILFILSNYFKKNIKLRLINCLIASFIMIFSNISIINNFSTNSHSHQLRQFFDIAGISVRIFNDEIFPDYVKEQNLYSFDKVNRAYTPCNFDPLFYGDSAVYTGIQNKDLIKLMNKDFFSAATEYPLQYTKHRLSVLLCNLNSSGSWQYSYVADKDKASSLGIPVNDNTLRKIVIKYLNLWPTQFKANFISFIITIFYILSITLYLNKNSSETKILLYISTIIIGYNIALFFTAVASDYRYYYIVRVLSFFSLPIYFKLLHIKFKKINMSK